MELTVKQLLERVEEQKAYAISGLTSSEGNDLYRFQGDYRTLEWVLGLPEQIEAEQAFDKQQQNSAEDV
jgi:hypothetical protein